MSTSQDFQQLLNNQLAQLNQLEQLIDEERVVLTQNDPDKLISLSENKNKLLIDIQNLDQQFTQSPAFTEQKQSGSFDSTLSVIEETLLRCKEKNQANGLIIQQSQLVVERMKTALLQQRSQSSVTYDNKGKTSGGLSSLGIKA